MRRWIVALLLLAGSARAAESARPLPPRSLENLVAAVRLAGYLRYFHPSDAAAAADWNLWTPRILAAAEPARDSTELARLLETTVRPLAPSLRLYTAVPPPLPAELRPRLFGRVIWWEHHGVTTEPRNPVNEGASRRVRRWVLAPGAAIVFIVVMVATAIGLVWRRRLRTAALPVAAIALALFLARPAATLPSRPYLAALGGGVSCSLPLALYDAGGVAPPPSAAMAADARATRLASVAMAWNVIEHFYPYFGEGAPRDVWPGVLRRALTKAAVDRDDAEFVDTLRAMAAELRDAHAYVIAPSRNAGRGLLPLPMVPAGDRIVLSRDVPPFAAGDEVISIDDTAIETLLAREERLTCASTDAARRAFAASELRRGPLGAPARVVARHAGREVSAELRYGSPAAARLRPRHAEVEDIAPGLLYVNLNTIPEARFRQLLPRLAAARGIIFDLRNYPVGFPEPLFLRHLIDRRVVWSNEQKVVVTRPDRTDMRFEDDIEELEPAEPRLRARIVFLAGSATISYAEHCIDAVQHYSLGTVVWQRTAGSTAAFWFINLPNHVQFGWGARHTRHLDGRQMQGVGNVPDVAAIPTAADWAAKRDVPFETAVALLR